MKRLFAFTILLFISMQVVAQAPHADKHRHELRSATHSLRSDTIDILNYDLHLFVPTTSGNISGYTAVTFSPKMNNIPNISFDLLKMTIDSIKIGTTILTYTYDDTLLIANFPTVLNDIDTSVIYVYYHGIPQQDPSAWGGWYFTNGYSFNLGVGFESLPHNFGRVFHPCFDNFMEHATYDFYITTTSASKAYSNGYLVSDTLDGNGNRVRYWRMDDPITSYLASIAVGNYVQVNQQYISPLTGDTIPIQLTSVATDTTNFKNSFINLPFAIEAYENGYGPHYFNKIGYVAVPFSSGAMEHATNIAFPRTFLNGTLYESVMAHELAHHWWGDLVTCKSAEHMWINEGMAVYSEKLFFENRYGAGRYRTEVRSNHKSTVWTHHIDDGGYWALSNVPQAVTYGSTSYSKGSDVAHTLRGYLGDSLFFEGLRTIMANNQLQNIDSDDFMNQLNAVNGIAVTDFFNDWVNTPGYPQFSIDSFVSVPSGGDFDVTVYLNQKLRGRTTYSNNVPLEITFRDNSWNSFTTKIYSSGNFNDTTVTVPFTPTYAALDESEKISDAITDDQQVIETTGSKAMTYAMFSCSVQTIADSCLLRVEHNWVPPTGGTADPTIILSPDRYWKIHGVNLQNMTANANFTFNGTTTSIGNLDNGLLVDHGAVLFHEDSVVLLYREKTSDLWTEFPTYSVNIQGDPLNKAGIIVATNITAGEYAFGMRVYGVGIHENNKTDIKLFPNPNDGNFKINMGQSSRGEYKFSLYDSNGALIAEKTTAEKEFTFSPGELAQGIYYLSVSNKKKLVANIPVSVVK